MRPLVIATTMWLSVTCAYGQQNAEEIPDLQRMTDELLAPGAEEVNHDDAFENLVQVLSDPLDLNTVTEEELKLLCVLTDAQIKSLIAYREDQGKFLDVHELQVVPGYDDVVISRLLPFVRVVDPATRVNTSVLKRMLLPGNSYFVTRYERTFETKRGYEPVPGSGPAYAGSPDKLYFRFRSSVSGDYSIGITGEKDAGEKMMFGPRKHQWGFDFTSWHVQLRNKGKLRNLIAGDFQAQFGQGLVLGGAFGLGKGGESVAAIRKTNVGFRPYTSIHESAYKRGLAITFSPARHAEISAFYSRARRDASTGDDIDSLAITSMQVTGYHRTNHELMNRKKVMEQEGGLVFRVNKGQVNGGAVINMTHFDMPVRRKPTLYNQFVFRGSSNLNAAVFLNITFANISFFTETARSFPGGVGTINGVLISAHPKLELAIVHRCYTKNFYSFYGNAFAENAALQNERGIYWGWRYRWDRRYSLNGFFDLFRFPWLGFRRYAPSQGYEWMLRAAYQPSSKISLFILLREEQKVRNSAAMTHTYRIEEVTRHSLSLQSDYGAGGSVRLKSRVQYNRQALADGTTEGWAVSQDVSLAFGRFNVSARHALFDTDHHDNRHYIYESDAWSSYALPAYSGVGVRNYALIEYKVSKRLTIWGRYSRTRMLTDEEIGTGQEVIEGNTRNDIKFQARYRF